ncbi:MAG: class I SAM-dependent methyltransferase, partial [Hyphomicrobiales bacterium]
KLHRFKRTMELPRVKAVLGALRGIGPQDLLDIGSGRGAFLWPLLDGFPHLPVTATDLLDHRLAMLEAVRDGGIDRLSVHGVSVTDLTFEDDSFDVATVLEVLEHLDRPEQAVRELVRVARRFVVASVPSKEDDKPEHIQLFDGAALERLFTGAGARKVSITYVRGHIICVAGL